jgi:hypothetical protein
MLDAGELLLFCFTDLTLGSTFDAVDQRQPDRLAGETPSPTSVP